MYVGSYACMSQQFCVSCDCTKCFYGAVFCLLHVCMLSDIDTDLFHIDMSIDKYCICEIYVCVCVCVQMHVWVFVCMYACMHVWVFICIYVKNHVSVKFETYATDIFKILQLYGGITRKGTQVFASVKNMEW